MDAELTRHLAYTAESAKKIEQLCETIFALVSHGKSEEALEGIDLLDEGVKVLQANARVIRTLTKAGMPVAH